MAEQLMCDHLLFLCTIMRSHQDGRSAPASAPCPPCLHVRTGDVASAMQAASETCDGDLRLPRMIKPATDSLESGPPSEQSDVAHGETKAR